MRVFLLFFIFSIFNFSFTQDHQKKVNEFLTENQLKATVEYIEENDLQDTEGFRYDYWNSKRRLDYSEHPNEMKAQALKEAEENSESLLIEYMFIYHHYNNKNEDPSEEMKKEAMELEKKIDQLNAKDPFYARLNIQFAEFLMDLGYFEEAMKRSKLALKADPKVLNGNLIHGYAMILKDANDKGINFIEKEFKNHKSNPAAYWVMADLMEYMKGGCDEKCLKYKALAFQVAPEEIEYFIYYVNTLVDEGYYDLVIENISVVEQDIDHPILTNLKAEALMYMGQFQDSKFVCEQALKKDPKNETLLYIQSQNLLYLDELDEALKVALQLNTVAPDDDINKYTLAEVYYYQEEDELALQICEKEIKNESTASMFYLMVSDIYFERDDFDKGTEYFEKGYTQEDFWDEVGDFQIVIYLESNSDGENKAKVNAFLKDLEENFEDETKFCIRDYYHYKVNEPDNQGQITVKCKEYIEGLQLEQ